MPAPKASNRVNEAFAFGRRWLSDVPLAAFAPAGHPGGGEAITLRRREVLEPRGPILHKSGNGELYGDGARVLVRDEAMFDLRPHGPISWVAGEAWKGYFPPETYSVVAAIALAMRGALPLHASAVAIDGQGVLLCGAAGAGKSTLAAGLCAIGARLVSDDLSVVTGDPQQALRLHTGRRSIRLVPAMAQALASAMALDDRPEGPRGKLLAYPELAAPEMPVPLKRIVLLSPGAGPEAGSERTLAETLLRIQFRPRWMSHLPCAAQRLALFDQLARQVPVRRFATHPVDSREGLEAVARSLVELALA